MGVIGTLHVMIGIGTGAVNIATSGALFVATSFVSSGSQKKENSDSESIFEGWDEVIPFVCSASGSQKKEYSVMCFVRGVIGDETIFLGGPIQSFLTC